MKRKLTIVALLAILLPTTLVYGQMAKDQLAIKYSKLINKDDLKKHLSILASDEYEGRETGKEGQQKAAEYLANRFDELGLPRIGESKSFYQVYGLKQQEWKEVFIQINDQRYEFLKDFYCFHFNNPEETITAKEVVFLGFGIQDVHYDDFANMDVKGKILVILDGEPINKKGKSHILDEVGSSRWSRDWTRKTITATAHEAAAILVVKEDIESSITRMSHTVKKPSLDLELNKKESETDKEEEEGFEMTNSFYVSKDMAANLLGLVNKDLDKIRKKINKKGKPLHYDIPVDIQISIKKDIQKIEATNVLGFIEGTDKKEEVIVVTAHYDHIGINEDDVFNGADDDGSGTVALLEMAEAFARAKNEGHGPKRSILFMPVSGEEKGLLGSEFYTENPVFPLSNTVANLNIDMIGRVDKAHQEDSNYVYIIGSDFLSEELHEINESANNMYTNMKLDYTYNKLDDPNRFYYRSDHYNFAKNDVPVIFYFNGTHADYHKASDTIDKIDFSLLEKRTLLVFFTAWHLANSEDRIELSPKEVPAGE